MGEFIVFDSPRKGVIYTLFGKKRVGENIFKPTFDQKYEILIGLPYISQGKNWNHGPYRKKKSRKCFAEKWQTG